LTKQGVGFEDIIVGDINCTGEFIKSKLGAPDKEVKNEKDWWLNYRKTTGLGFWVNPQENLLIEIRLNKGFKGKLTSGISMSSTKQDVFDVYGEPIRQEVADDFDERFDNQVLFTKKPSLWRKSHIDKIHYNEQGLLFWFDGDTLDQIVVYRKMETQKSDERKFTATLRNGVMVELIGVCDWTNEEVRKWRPDGIPLNQDIYLEKAHFEKWDDNFGFFAKFTGPEDMSTKWLGISGAIHSSSTYPIFDRQGDKLKDYEGATGKIVDGRASTSIRFGGATGPWRTIAEFDGDRKISGEDNVVFSSPIESKNGTVIAVRGEWKFDGVRRITVTDTKGREHHGGWHGRSSSEHTLATTEFRNLSPKQIQSYKVQFRPYQWVTFNNVSIKPDFKTDVKVEVGKVAQRPVTTYEDKPQWIPSEWLGDTSEKNYALQFDGTDDYVKIPSSPSLDIHGSLTLSAWVKNNGDNDGQIIWRGDNKGGRDPYELHVTNGRMEFRIDAGKGTSYKVQSKEVLDNKGHFWTGVYDKKAGQIYLYKDGVREGNSSIYEEIEYDTSSMWNMIGTVDFGNWQHFRGVIDEVRIWNTARTKKQIKRYMNRSLRGDEANLVACWKFDEGSGQILKDSTKNHNDGQLNNWKGSTGYIRPGANPKVQVETGNLEFGTKEDQWTDLLEEIKQLSSKIQQWSESIPVIDANLASEFNKLMNEVLPEMLKAVENGVKNITELQKRKVTLEQEISKVQAEAEQLRKENASTEQLEAVDLKMQSLQQKHELLEKQLEEQEDLFDKELEPLAERLEQRVEIWGEQFGGQIEDWFDQFEEKLEEQIEQWEEEFEQQMEEIDNQLDELDEKLEVDKSTENVEKPDLVTSPNLWSRILPDGSLIKLCAVFRPKDKPLIFWDPEGNIIQGPKLAKWDYGNINDKELAVVFEVPKELEGQKPAPDGKFYQTYGWKEIEPKKPLVASYARGYGDWVDMGEIMEGENLGGYNLTEIDEVDMPKFKQIRAKMFWRFNPDFGIRLIAIDKKGKEYPMKPSDIFIGFGKSSKGQQILYYQAAIGLNKKELSHFKLQRRSLAWASFSDFATKPLKNIMQKEKDIPPIGKYALEFDGIDDYLEIHASESLQLGRHFTIQMWIKPEFPDTSTPDNERNLISKGGYILGYPDDKNNRKTKNYGFGFKLTPEEESQIGLDVCQGSNKGMTIVKRIFEKSSDWLHLAVVFDDGEGSVYPGMYFDISPDSYEPALKSNINIGGQFLLPSGNYFKGQIAELRIWNRALTSDEIAEYKTMTLTGNEPNLVACWTFEQTEGREAIDISPYKNDARLGSSYGADDSDPVWVRIEN